MKLVKFLPLLFWSPTAVLGFKAPRTSSAALLTSVPRGGGQQFPIPPKAMVKVFCSLHALNGITSFPAPESAKPFALKEGTPDYVVFENLGAISLAYASLVYLTAFSYRSASNIVALSSLPCAYVSYKNMLKGLTERLSGSKIQGPATTIFLVGGIYCLLNGKGNTQQIATALAVLPLIIGLTSQVDLRLGMKLAGFGNSVSGKKGEAIYVWYAAHMAGYGALALMRLHSSLSAMDTIARAAALETLFMIDCIWIRKWNIGVAPNASNYVFLGIPLLTAITLFLRK